MTQRTSFLHVACRLSVGQIMTCISKHIMLFWNAIRNKDVNFKVITHNRASWQMTMHATPTMVLRIYTSSIATVISQFVPEAVRKNFWLLTYVCPVFTRVLALLKEMGLMKRDFMIWKRPLSSLQNTKFCYSAHACNSCSMPN